MPAQEEIAATIWRSGRNGEGVGKAKTILCQKHHMKPGKHFWNRILPENNSWPEKEREPLPFSKAKGDIRE